MPLDDEDVKTLVEYFTILADIDIYFDKKRNENDLDGP